MLLACKNPALPGNGGATAQCAHHSASLSRTVNAHSGCSTATRGFPGSSDKPLHTSKMKTSVCLQCLDPGLIPELGRSPGEGNGYPLQYSCLKNPMDRRSLVGHSPWGCKESDMTEWLTLSPPLRKVGTVTEGRQKRDVALNNCC